MWAEPFTVRDRDRGRACFCRWRSLTGSETPLRPARQQASHCGGKASHQIHLPRNHCGAQGHQVSLAPFAIKGAPLLKRARTQDPRARPRVTPPSGPVLSGPDRRIRAARPKGACDGLSRSRLSRGVRAASPHLRVSAPRKRAPGCARPQSWEGGSFGLKSSARNPKRG